ncbi:MAG: 4-hydroxy-tetrahydrodipicolinate synthase [Clostridia bacterium]|nr:4-hydroxy-tetrahydrodipicolinate synthase [Clostridia bacterium]
MKKNLFIGCGTALVTPFTEDGICFEELEKLLEFQIEQGADALIICGTTGEASTMSLEEKKQVIEFSVHIVHKRIPVIAGTGGNNTKSVIELSTYAKSIGVDGLLLVTPYYNKTTQSGLVMHYSEIAKHVSLPIILYNVPSRTGLNITPETCFELSKISNIVGIKEASGNLSQVAQIANLCGDNLAIYSGNDDQTLPILSLGGIGVISVLSNLMPKFVHNMVYDYLSGNFTLAKDAQIKCIPLIHSLFSEVNPIPVKTALNLMDYKVGTPRLPLVPMSCIQKETLKQEMKKLKLI